jgi:predicted amidohydrolase YtcJ
MALAVTGGVVVALGEEALALEGPQTERVELGDGVAWPGLIDSHVHMLAGSFVLDRLTLLGVGSMERLVEEVSDYAAEAPDEPWVVGYGWLPEQIEEPDGRLLDAAVPDRPVLLVDNSGHQAMVNGEALRRAGISAETPDPPDGSIVRDEVTGEPTGWLLEGALALVSEVALADYNDEALAAGLPEAMETFTKGGITTVAEIMASPGFDLARPGLYAAQEEAGALPMRVHWFVPIFEQGDLAEAAGFLGETEGLARFSGGKIWVDGSMGTSEAWMSEPLETDPDSHGAHYFDSAELTDVVDEAEERGLALKLHVNGDAAVDAALDAMEAVATLRGGLLQQHVLEHAVLCDDDDRRRMAELGVVASVQPAHWLAAQFGDVVNAWGEERFAQAYDHRALLDAGVELALGTDWPVWITPDGPVQLWAAAQRGEPGMSRGEAMWAYTRGGGQALGRQDLGCLDPGCAADIVLFADDPLVVEVDRLSSIAILGTWVGGRAVSPG